MCDSGSHGGLLVWLHSYATWPLLLSDVSIWIAVMQCRQAHQTTNSASPVMMPSAPKPFQMLKSKYGCTHRAVHTLSRAAKSTVVAGWSAKPTENLQTHDEGRVCRIRSCCMVGPSPDPYAHQTFLQCRLSCVPFSIPLHAFIFYLTPN